MYLYHNDHNKGKILNADTPLPRFCDWSLLLEDLTDIERYLLCGEYPAGLSKGDKANLRRRCRNNFKLEAGVLYYRRASGEDDESGEPWRIAVKTEDDRQRILESYHAGVGGRLHAPCLGLERVLCACRQLNHIILLQEDILTVIRQFKKLRADSIGRIWMLKSGPTFRSVTSVMRVSVTEAYKWKISPT
jgi:hypothetical protein